MDNGQGRTVREVTCRRCVRRGRLVGCADGQMVGRTTRSARPVDLAWGDSAARGTCCSAPWSALIGRTTVMAACVGAIMTCDKTWAVATVEELLEWHRAASGRPSKGR